MQAAELETDFDAGIPRARAGRALALIAASLVAIVTAGIAFVHPIAGVSAPALPVAGLTTDYRVSSVDFVTPSVGWLVVDFSSGDYAVIHTVDGGSSWTTQRVGPSNGHIKYMSFFDASVGVVALVGTQPLLWRTSDGGVTWVARDPLGPLPATALSWSFVDSDHGWMLATPRIEGGLRPARLYRTEDGGVTWVDLGPPVPAQDQAFQVQFSYLTTGWLTTTSSGPYAYRTQDFGTTWTRVPLPAPREGWPSGGEFFVAVRPTTGLGVVASVVHFASFAGRSGVGGTVRAYPPLTVRSFDGGRLRTYLYTTVLDQVVTGPFASDTPPNQTELGTVDNGRTWSGIDVPYASGAVGYSDATHWWWIGQGMWAHSADGGSTWTDPLDIGVVDPLPGSLQVLDSRHAWFAGASGRRAMLETTDDAGLHWTLSTLPALEDRPTGP